MFSKLNNAIINTLIYADIFSYPLTIEEIHQRMIGYQTPLSLIKKHIGQIPQIEHAGKYYFLKGRKDVVNARNHREKFAVKKWQIAIRIGKLLKIIPTVKMIAVTGALAINNADEKDDIDFFIITSAKRLWLTRFLVTLLTEFTGRRLHPNDKNQKDKICLNMYFDELHLTIPKNEQDLYIAYEIILMKLIFDRDNTFQKFLSNNHWVRSYLPQFFIQKEKHVFYKNNIWFFNIMEKMSKILQLAIMKDKITTEVIKEGIIKFHKHDSRRLILSAYKNRIGKYMQIT